MKYISYDQSGGPEVLEVKDTDIPSIGQGQVLIKVAAIGVNRPDVAQRQGAYPPPPGASQILGLEVAGEVIETANDINWPNRGDQVCALLTGGGYAEYAVADAQACLPIPEGRSATEAAALPETFFTVWSNVFDRGRLKQGESLLVHGGSSGIGTTAIQLGKAFGATVYATAGTDEKCSVCRDLGADVAINYKRQDFVEECKKATGNKGVDVILDMVLGDYLNRNIELAAPDGRIVLISALGGSETQADFLKVMFNRLTITGSTLRSRPVEFKAEIAKSLKLHVWPLLESGEVKPLIHCVLPLEKAAEAHRIMESSKHIGKIVLTT